LSRRQQFSRPFVLSSPRELPKPSAKPHSRPSSEDDDELDRLAMAYSPKLQKIPTLARQQIKEHGGIPHAEFWEEVEAKGKPAAGK
jgi:hypothetical protein